MTALYRRYHMKVSRFLTARYTVIVLLTAISAALLVASAVPQRTSSGGKTPEWVGRLPDGLHFISTVFGLDNIVGTVWFAVLVSLFWVSLVVSTWSQFTAIREQIRRVPSATVPPESSRVDVGRPAFAELALQSGYRLAGGSGGVYRYIKNRPGYWGNFLLHIGLVIAVFFSIVYVLTQHRVLIRLAGQEVTRLSSETVQELRGLLQEQQKLPYSVVLKNLYPRYWGNDKLESLSTELYFTDRSGGEPQRVNVAISDKARFDPYIVYQSNVYGRTFDLEFISPRGKLFRERLYLPYPTRRDVAGYGEQAVSGTDFLLKGKFYADTERKLIQLHGSPLTLRLYRGKEQLGEVTLTVGSNGQLGELAVRLTQSEWWTDILLDGTRGTAGIFAGFAMILAGVLCSYVLVPREIIARELNGAVYAQHIVRRFPHFYREEFDDIIQKARTTGEL